MLEAVPTSIRRQFNKRLLSLETQDGSSTLTFADGSTATADCVIGCDGIKSALRSMLHPPKDGYGVIRYSGSYCYRGLIDRKALQKAGYEAPDLPRMYLGPQQHILAFPVDHGKTVNVVAFSSDRSLPLDERQWNGHPKLKTTESPAPWVIPVEQQLMLDDFGSFCDQAQILLKHIDKPSCWALHELTDLERWTFGSSVALMGDAACATTPHQGAGAGQALESGYTLGRLLSRPECNRETLGRHLQLYEKIRKERHDKVKNSSRENGEVMELCGYGTVAGLEGKPLAWDQSEQGWKDLGAECEHRTDWIFHEDVKANVDRIIREQEAQGL